jgi:hypothetical protein
MPWAGGSGQITKAPDRERMLMDMIGLETIAIDTIGLDTIESGVGRRVNFAIITAVTFPPSVRQSTFVQ